ncbi:MAG: hypothetical protein U0359_27725 [Byssovorax sp.]
MTPPPFADLGAASGPKRSIHPDAQAVLDMPEADIEEGIARCAAQFDLLSPEEREQIDAVGWGSRRPKTP